MSSKLTKINPHLRDPVARERAILKSVAGSSAIEGIRAPFPPAKTRRISRTRRKG